jgi:signal transduction histidine kinase
MAAQELQRISEIVSQTLRFHRAPAKPAFTDVAELATSALALFRGKLRERNISEFIAAEPTFAFCSAGEIRQAVVNLIGNALDAMADGGRLHLRVSSVSRNGAPCARLTIADTGSGIRAEIRSSLFNQFFTTKGSRGTGLGLWLTRDIVLRNCGRLRFRSRTSTPSGTVFTIYLPSVPPATLAPADASSRRNEPATIEAA